MLSRDEGRNFVRFMSCLAMIPFVRSFISSPTYFARSLGHSLSTVCTLLPPAPSPSVAQTQGYIPGTPSPPTPSIFSARRIQHFLPLTACTGRYGHLTLLGTGKKKSAMPGTPIQNPSKTPPPRRLPLISPLDPAPSVFGKTTSN